MKISVSDDNGPRKSSLIFGDVPGSGGTLTFNGPPSLGFDDKAFLSFNALQIFFCFLLSEMTFSFAQTMIMREYMTILLLYYFKLQTKWIILPYFCLC